MLAVVQNAVGVFRGGIRARKTGTELPDHVTYPTVDPPCQPESMVCERSACMPVYLSSHVGLISYQRCLYLAWQCASHDESPSNCLRRTQKPGDLASTTRLHCPVAFGILVPPLTYSSSTLPLAVVYDFSLLPRGLWFFNTIPLLYHHSPGF